MRSVLLSIVVLFVSLETAGPASAGPVDAARSKQAEGCADGVGTTYLFEEMEAALDSDTYEGFVLRRDACTERGFLGYSLDAMCSSALPSTDRASLVIYCLIDLRNPSDTEILEISEEQFTLASNSSRIASDRTLLDSVDPEYVFPDGPLRVYPSTSANVLLAFPIQEEQRDADFVLIWHVPEDAPERATSWRRLQVLFDDREDRLLDYLNTRTANDLGSPGADAIFTFSGRSDAVSDPIALPAGIYIAHGSFSGNGNFIAHVLTPDGSRQLIANAIDVYAGQATFMLETDTNVIFEVSGDGSWEIAIKPAF
jgi:hypothetical protein